MFKRWLVLVVIGMVVMSGLSGCVLVVADEEVAHEIREERNRSRLTRDIQREIDDDSALQYSEIEVREHNGKVTLRGDVDSLDALHRAIEIVLREPGVDDLALALEMEIRLD